MKAVLLALALAFEALAFRPLGEIEAASLPPEARETIALIRKGGRFPYARDGATFANREALLPKKARGYYREFTVNTPGSRDRGARRIVAGAAGELYYTDDHYRSFRRVIE
jgi:ribonuclease T1